MPLQMVKLLGWAVDEGLRGSHFDGRSGGDRADCGEAGEGRGGGTLCSFGPLDPFFTLFFFL